MSPTLRNLNTGRWIQVGASLLALYRGRKQDTTYLLLAAESSFPSSATSFLFRGCGLWTNVQSCLWNLHKTHATWPSCITHLLFRLLQASHGRSFRVRVLGRSPSTIKLLMLEEAFGFILSFAGVSFLAWLGLAAMGMGAVRGIEMGVDMASRRPGESAQGTGVVVPIEPHRRVPRGPIPRHRHWVPGAGTNRRYLG